MQFLVIALTVAALTHMQSNGPVFTKIADKTTHSAFTCYFSMPSCSTLSLFLSSKVENILLTRDSSTGQTVAKLSDFGVHTVRTTDCQPSVLSMYFWGVLGVLLIEAQLLWRVS